MVKRNNKQLNKLYSKPLPIILTSHHYDITLPTLYPHNPISWIWFMIRYFQINMFYSVPKLEVIQVDYEYEIFKVVDDENMMKLWRMGFFGKGILSRSEPTWKERVRKSNNVDSAEDVAMEDITKMRREERKLFKSTRADLQQLELKDRQGIISEEEVKQLESLRETVQNLRKKQGRGVNSKSSIVENYSDLEVEEDWEYLEQLEYLQLQFVEIFFLKFALNVVVIPGIRSNFELFKICCYQYDKIIEPNNKFIIDYIVYHHFRTLGWCVRSGIKFGSDFLLYKRGPPFIHAEYCILVMKSNEQEFDWFQMAAKARVIGTVKKVFVLVYVECPSIEEFNEVITSCEQVGDDNGLAIKQLLSKYKASEILYRRWSPSRTRD